MKNTTILRAVAAVTLVLLGALLFQDYTAKQERARRVEALQRQIESFESSLESSLVGFENMGRALDTESR